MRAFHTPGPWKPVDEGLTIGIEGPNGESVATCGGGDLRALKATLQDWADAHLIAASPEMFELLYRISNADVIPGHVNFLSKVEIAKLARAVIAKAEGRK